ncbi:hypothetical protein H6P81_009338 [Aristolochia fimbriata]|uniref:START domain-containing protein n=1 Tax=Aristolochia fimbriata TaxID=158543 RepID=A0AAV7EQ32_ARIFI|nr:hypothetical protein H6P81_009338 [Aristolochia fimbriata]
MEMSKHQIFPGISSSFLEGTEEFWRENGRAGWATVLVVLLIIVWQVGKSLIAGSQRVVRNGTEAIPKSSQSGTRISEIVSDTDLRNLINDLDGKLDGLEKWDDVIEKRNNLLSYMAKCCKPKDGPLKYFSVTTFEKCSTELLADFYMDNEYRKKWDKTLVSHEQLQVDETSATEIGRTVKKFPLLTPREYILAWRIWEGKEKTFYCFIKECEHPLAPRQKKYVRVSFFRSGWRIRKVPGRDACEIAMVHQEDAGLNVEMAKLAFSKGIWSYVCKMDSALRSYPLSRRTRANSSMCNANLVRKVPPQIEAGIQFGPRDFSESSNAVGDPKRKTFLKRPSRKLIANGLLLLGGVVCLSRGHSSFGAKIAMACILKKLSKHQVASSNPGLGKNKREPISLQ